MEESEVSEVQRMESIVASLKLQRNRMNGEPSSQFLSVGASSESIISHIQKDSQNDPFLVVPGAIEMEKNRFHTSIDGGGGCCVIT